MKSEKIAEARNLRDGGETYQAIADALGVNRETIRYNLIPEVREKQFLNTKRYRREHKEEQLAYDRRYYARHKEEAHARNRRCYAKHKKERNAFARQYYMDHREEKRAYGRQYYADHKEERCAYRKQYYIDHKEKVRKHQQAHKSERNANSAKRRSLIAEATIGDMDQIRETYRIAREEPIVRCYLCLKLIPMGDRAVDHIFPVSKGGPFRPSTLAVTHKECNGRKGAKTPEEIGLLL